MFNLNKETIEKVAGVVWEARRAKYADGDGKMPMLPSFINRSWEDTVRLANEGDQFQQFIMQSHIETINEVCLGLTKLFPDFSVDEATATA